MIGLMGLLMKSTAPSSKPSTSSDSCCCAVMNIMGMSWVAGSALSRRHTSCPSMPSMTTSSRIRSGRRVWHIVIACSPLVAMNTSQSLRNNSGSTRISIGWSSTMRSFGRLWKCGNQVSIDCSIRQISTVHDQSASQRKSLVTAP
ncbi:hypothetical protein D3C86_1594180 [compost metagenome]